MQLPNLRLPCSPWSAASHFDEKQSLGPGNGLQKPTASEYTSEAAKGFLKVLESVAQDIPVPGIGPAVKIATNLINACEESRATLEKAEELKIRIKTLITAVVNQYKGQKSGDVNGKLREDLDSLQSELNYIEKRLNEIASQHPLLLVFFRSVNEQKVQACINRLDIMIEGFTVVRHLDHAILLERLEKDITSFYNAQQHTLNHIHGVVDTLSVTMEDVRLVMKKLDSPVATASPSANARATIPASTSLFYGRDALTADLVAHLTHAIDDQKHRHICILGPGGMGKTSAALAVMAHPDVKDRYTEGHRVWVPCIKATSIPILLDTLASSLGITRATGIMIDNILSALGSAGPLILLLDNFETPWNIEGGRSETERILRDIDQIPHITLFITMRSSAPPCRALSWHSTDLKAVDAEAARQIYTKIYPESSADPNVPDLLELVGNMPLAIILMATSASLSRLTAKDLMDQYQKTGTTMLSQGSDNEDNVDICISLSVQSSPMKRGHEAQWLLSALAMLPIGTTYSMLATWWARHLSNITGALQVLRETALVELRESTFFVLPVIQRYVLDPSRFDPAIRDSMISCACQFLAHHNSSPGDASHKEHTAALSVEEGNLEAVLLQTVDPSKEILDGLLILAKYQAWIRPRTNVINHALTLAEKMGDPSIHGAVLTSYATICNNLSRFEECRKHYMNARTLFLSVPDVKQAANCLLESIYTYRYEGLATSETSNSLIVQAESEFESIGDVHGVAQCWLHRGNTACHETGNYDEAISLMRRAKDKFTELGDPIRSAQCSDGLAWCYYWLQDFDQARVWSESAVDQFTRIGPSDGNIDALLLMGIVYNALGNHAVALQRMVRSLEVLKVSGGPVDVGLALEQMGIAWMQTGKREDALGAFQKALESYPLSPGRRDHVRCRYWLKRADHLNAIATLEEWSALQIYYPVKILVSLGVKEPEGGACSS